MFEQELEILDPLLLEMLKVEFNMVINKNVSPKQRKLIEQARRKVLKVYIELRKAEEEARGNS